MSGDGFGFVRRARPALGTLVEIGLAAALRARRDPCAGDAVEAAFDGIARLEAELSRFVPTSDIARFNALRAGERLALCASTRDVLAAASELFEASGGVFDISTGTSPRGWKLVGDEAIKLHEPARLDLGGIAKGYIVDRTVQCLMDRGVEAGWVNAGGDLRAFGDVELPIVLRGGHGGAAGRFAMLSDGAFATSRYGPGARSRLAGGRTGAAAYVSVAAPRCLWADALTKLVAATGDAGHPLLRHHGACAWLH